MSLFSTASQAHCHVTLLVCLLWLWARPCGILKVNAYWPSWSMQGWTFLVKWTCLVWFSANFMRKSMPRARMLVPGGRRQTHGIELGHLCHLHQDHLGSVKEQSEPIHVRGLDQGDHSS